MGTLYLVRHGQASFGEDNYDRLSPLGHQQARRLGEYLRERFAREQVHIDSVLMGSLTRHRETWQGMAEGAGWTHTPQVREGLNEYDSQALIEAIHPAPLARPDTPELYRHHFRLLREALQAWIAGRIQPRGMPSYAGFVQGVEDALVHVREQCSGNALIVSSGGPIATALGRVLGTPAETTIELNLRIRNTALAEFQFNPKRHSVLTWNTLPHLEGPAYQRWVTYA
jgi:broad specificity phosphatase PhoE